MSADGGTDILARAGRLGSAAAAEPPIAHGGDLSTAAARYGIAESAWLDLSTGINPHPYRHGAISRQALARLPQRDAEARLLAAARGYFGLGPGAGLVAAPGSQALIQWLPRLLPPRRVAVLSPTYGEHARAWALAGHAVRSVHEPEDAAGDTLLLTNPNNPDGKVLPPARLLDVAGCCAASGNWLVVDEAFADAHPETSVIAECGRPGLIVLRSFGKFFGLGGLRLGFAAAEPAVAEAVRAALGPWSVSAPALAIAALAYGDTAWIETSRKRLARSAARLDRLAAAHGLDRVGGTDLFRLYGHDAAPILAEHLARAGILVRRFAGQSRWLRVGLPDAAADWRRLGAALASWQQEQSRNVRDE